jgi:hypothetical protein
MRLDVGISSAIGGERGGARGRVPLVMLGQDGIAAFLKVAHRVR